MPSMFSARDQTRGDRAARYSRRAMRLFLLLIVLSALLAGCGGAEPSVYKAPGSAKCLRKLGYRVVTQDQQVGAGAAAAPHGGLRAFQPGNTRALTVCGCSG